MHGKISSAEQHIACKFLYFCVLTAGIDNADSRRFPDEVVDRFIGFCRYIIWQDGFVISDESKSHGTVQLTRIINIRCGNDTFVQDMI